MNQYYTVTEDGKVFSKRAGKFLKPYPNQRGHLRVQPMVNGVQEKHFVHRLVATKFIPNPSNLPVVHHKDNNPSNNHVSNLEWTTHQANVQDGWDRGRIAYQSIGIAAEQEIVKAYERIGTKRGTARECGVHARTVSRVLERNIKV